MHNRRKPQGPLFDKITYAENIDFLVESLREDIRPAVKEMLMSQVRADIPDAEKMKRAKIIIKAFQQPEVVDFISSMSHDPEQSDQQIAVLKKMMTAYETEITKLQTEPSYLAHVVETMGIAYLGNLLPGVGTLLLGMPVASAALQAGREVYSGIPAGGADLCFGNTLTCIQGFIAEAANRSMVFGQFSRQVDVAMVGGEIDTSFADCLSLQRIGEIVSPLMKEIKNQTVDCLTNSEIVKNTMATVKATNLDLTSQNCTLFSAKMKPVFDACKNPSSNNALWIGLGVGGAALLTAIALFLIIKRCMLCSQKQQYQPIV
jgi:hypothetical protein